MVNQIYVDIGSTELDSISRAKFIRGIALYGRDALGSPKRRKREEPKIEIVPIIKKASLYPPVASRMYPANKGIIRSNMFIGTCEMPMIAANALLPK